MRTAGLPVRSALGTHLTDPATLDAVPFTFGGAGVVLGRQPDGALATVPLFRPEPTSVFLLGSTALAQLVAFRSLAVGASVAVESRRPGPWPGFAHLAAGSSGTMALAEGPVRGSGTATAPLLVVRDPDPGPDQPAGPAGWTTTLTVVGQLTPANRDALSGADLVLVQSATLAEARAVASALARPEAEQLVAALPEEDVGAVTRHGVRTWSSAPTSVERWLIGSVGRTPGSRRP